MHARCRYGAAETNHAWDVMTGRAEAGAATGPPMCWWMKRTVYPPYFVMPITIPHAGLNLRRRLCLKHAHQGNVFEVAFGIFLKIAKQMIELFAGGVEILVEAWVVGQAS